MMVDCTSRDAGCVAGSESADAPGITAVGGGLVSRAAGEGCVAAGLKGADKIAPSTKQKTVSSEKVRLQVGQLFILAQMHSGGAQHTTRVFKMGRDDQRRRSF